MLRILLPLSLCLFLFTACDDDAAGGQGGAVPATTTNDPAMPQASAPMTSNTGGQRLNPPHGEPGHICEIGVGEPLPEDGTMPPPQVQIGDAPPGLDVTSTVISPPMGGSPSGPMGGGGSGQPNPPHGEPGHVCEIPVGEPLP